MSVITKLFLGLCVSFFSLAPRSAFAQQSSASTDGPDRVITLLSQISKDLGFLFDEGVQKADQARVFVLKKSTDDALASYIARPVHMQTQYAIFNMYSRFKVSGTFFQFIQTGYNQAAVQELFTSFDQLAAELGLEDSPYMRIIAVNLKQILEQVQILTHSPDVSDTLKFRLNALIPALGQAISVANNGDRPSAFAEAEKIYGLIRDLYDPLEAELAPNQALFISYMEIVGTNEFLGDFAEVSR